MKNITWMLLGFMLLISNHLSHSGGGTFFTLRTSGTTLNIATSGSYPTAGVKITSGQPLFCHGSSGPQGYCIFSATSTSPNNVIGFRGTAGTISVNLCLNGNGPASCAPYTTSLAPYRGINYDPAHSTTYTTAQTDNVVSTMNSSMMTDFTQIKANGFLLVKTYISIASTDNGTYTNSLASIACPMGLKLMLGVYEFTPSDGCSDNAQCITWTQPQITAAIASVKQYPNCIVGIAVGNEDIYDYTFTIPNIDIQQRIVADITTIRNAIGTQTPIGSAQQDGAWLALASNDTYGIIPLLDFVGANIYPYWSGTSVTAAPTEFTNRLNAVETAYPNTRVSVTEEGWPSDSTYPAQPQTSLSNEVTYYQYWLNRAPTDNFDSYYFAFYDKQNSGTDTDANNNFGLCTDTAAEKSASLITCVSG